MGAPLTRPGHASTARWCGFGERDEEESDRGGAEDAIRAGTCTSLRRMVAVVAFAIAGSHKPKGPRTADARCEGAQICKVRQTVHQAIRRDPRGPGGHKYPGVGPCHVEALNPRLNLEFLRQVLDAQRQGDHTRGGPGDFHDIGDARAGLDQYLQLDGSAGDTEPKFPFFDERK